MFKIKRTRQKKLTVPQKISTYAPVTASALGSLTPLLIRAWIMLRQKFNLAQLKGMGASLGSVLVTFAFSVWVAREIGEAIAQHSKNDFRKDLLPKIRASYYKRYLFYRFFTLSAYSFAMAIGVGEIFIFAMGGALSAFLIPSFVVGVSLFIVCQVVDLIRLRDEWRFARSTKEREEIENQIITTWIGLGLLAAGFVVGFLGFSFVSTAFLVASGVVFALKVVNAILHKGPIKRFFDSIGLPLFRNDCHKSSSIPDFMPSYSRMNHSFLSDSEEELFEVSSSPRKNKAFINEEVKFDSESEIYTEAPSNKEFRR